MIQFRQKEYTEHDVMRLLYIELKKDGFWRDRVKVINRSSIIPVLRGNNILIERFVISTNLFSKDKYRLYIKIGAQAKLPDEVRLPEIIRQRKVLNAKLDLKTAGGPYFQNEFSETEEDLLLREKLFGNKKKNKGGNNNNNNNGNNNNNNNQASPSVYTSVSNTENGYNLMYDIRYLLGEAVKYDKRDRSLVLEFDGPREDAIRSIKEALNILPFGLEYNIYLLDV